MATHSSVLAWRILGTVEPGGLPSMGSRRVEHDWSDLTAAAIVVKPSLLCSKSFGYASFLRKTRVPSLIQENFAYHGAAKAESHNH